MTRRSLVIGIIGCLLIGVIAPYSIHILRASYMALDFSTPLAISLLFLLSLCNYKWHFLSAKEVVVVYCMLIVGSSVVTMGMVSQVIPLPAGATYYATPENHWAELLSLPAWVSVSEGAALGLYEGVSLAPWGVWALVLGRWSILLFGLYLAMLSTSFIIHKQWATNERLAFPLTALPLELAGGEKGHLFRSGPFWVGFTITGVLATLTGLHFYFPGIPKMDTVHNISFLTMRLSFPMLGFFYLAGNDVIFSLWSFNLFSQGASKVIEILGVKSLENLGNYGSPSILFKYLGTGAFLGLVGSGLYISKEHLREVWERKEWPVWGLGLGLVIVAWWLVASGLSIWLVVPFLVLAFVFFLGLTRIVAETGLAEAVAPSIAPCILAGLSGFGLLGQKGMGALGLSYVWCSDIRTFPMASATNSLKLMGTVPSEGTNVPKKGMCQSAYSSQQMYADVHKKRTISIIYWVGIIATALPAIWLTLSWAYTKGGINLDRWFFRGAAQAPWEWAADFVQKQPAPSLFGCLVVSVGTILYLLFVALRFKWGGILHPIGFCVGSTWIMNQLWFTAFIAWLLKGLVLRYGGGKGYKAVRNGCLGLICGQYVFNLVWAGIDFVAGGTGNRIFWI